jgi:alanine dehydrogenase
VRAVQAVRPIAEMAVFSTNPERRAAFARTFAAELGVPCRAVESARDAVRDATIIIGATRTRDRKPVLEGAWLAPGMLTVSIGATLPEQREIDVAAVAQAD